MKIELYRLGAERNLLRTVETNRDGRVDGALLEGEAFEGGSYELVFHAGDYLRQAVPTLPDPPFLDLIPIRFGIASRLGALSRAAAHLALRLFHLSGELTSCATRSVLQ